MDAYIFKVMGPSSSKPTEGTIKKEASSSIAADLDDCSKKYSNSAGCLARRADDSDNYANVD